MTEAVGLNANVQVAKENGMVTYKKPDGTTYKIEESLFESIEADKHELWAPKDKEGQYAFSGDRISLKNGVKLFYQESCDSNKPAVITVRKDDICKDGVAIVAENGDSLQIDAARNHQKDTIRLFSHDTPIHGVYGNLNDNIITQEVTGFYGSVSGISEALDTVRYGVEKDKNGQYKNIK